MYDVTYTYTYDGNGNILSVSDGENTTSYAYDSANQLIRENNQAAGKTWTWTYDKGGNITCKTEYAYTTGDLGEAVETLPYTYYTGSWRDLLTVHDGRSFGYDECGNLIQRANWVLTWEHGRQLASIKYSNTTWTHEHNVDGLRTYRSDGTTTYTYVYNGSTLSQMTVNGNVLYFVNDTVTYNGTTYYYVKNLQGDVVAILDASGNAVVEYTYNAWGVLLSTTGSMASTLGVHNPLRYRGYVYDNETELYYLQSRYYDPDVGRFINADAFASTGQGILGNNMFAYCLNNPVNMIDNKGTSPEAVAEWTKEALAGWTSTMWWLCSADTVLPFGDIIYGAGIFVLGVYTLAVIDEVATPQICFEEEKEPEPPNVTYPGDDPTKAPEGYEWRGPDEQGGKRGGYANPNGKDSWHPDLNHPDGIDPHWDYNDGLGNRWRVFPGRIERVIK